MLAMTGITVLVLLGGAYGKGAEEEVALKEPVVDALVVDAPAMAEPDVAPVPPQAGAAPVQESLIGTLQRRGGTTQVTYGGHPLYYYVKDEQAGRPQGKDVHDEWYLVRPSGEPLEEHGDGAEGS